MLTRFLSPHARERLIHHLDRPLGFYVTVMLVGLCTVFATDAHRQNPDPDKWPTWIVGILTACSIVLAICAGIIVVWLLRTAFWLCCRSLRRLRSR